VRHAAAQRLRGHVDQLDLLGGADHRVGHGLALFDAGDLGDHVVERLQVLDVDRGQHVDAGVEQFVHVLPALGVARAGDVGVCELVDDGDLGPAGEDGVDIHLGEPRAPVLHVATRHDLQVGEHGLGVLAPMGLDEGDDHVGAALGAPVGLFEHGVRLADARGGAQEDP
jgi:hypothetical protein